MRREQRNGRRIVLQVLQGVNIVIWGAGVAWAGEMPKSAQSKPAE